MEGPTSGTEKWGFNLNSFPSGGNFSGCKRLYGNLWETDPLAPLIYELIVSVISFKYYSTQDDVFSVNYCPNMVKN